MDWQALLYKYMDHVGVVEGTDFINCLNVYGWAPQFTPEEIAALKGE